MPPVPAVDDVRMLPPPPPAMVRAGLAGAGSGRDGGNQAVNPPESSGFESLDRAYYLQMEQTRASRAERARALEALYDD